MTTSDQEEQAERRRVLANDARLRDQSRDGNTGTYLSHTHSELGGRFAVTEHQIITGAVSPSPPPLPTNSPWSGSDPVPDEPPLGYCIDAMSELENLTGVLGTDDPAHAPSGGSSVEQPYGGLVSNERAGSSLSETMAAQRTMSQMASSSGGDDARSGRPPAPKGNDHDAA
jgi:hypothetical protein